MGLDFVVHNMYVYITYITYTMYINIIYMYTVRGKRVQIYGVYRVYIRCIQCVRCARYRARLPPKRVMKNVFSEGVLGKTPPHRVRLRPPPSTPPRPVWLMDARVFSLSLSIFLSFSLSFSVHSSRPFLYIYIHTYMCVLRTFSYLIVQRDQV